MEDCKDAIELYDVKRTINAIDIKTTFFMTNFVLIPDVKPCDLVSFEFSFSSADSK